MYFTSNSSLLSGFLLSLLIILPLKAQQNSTVEVEQQYVISNWNNTNGLPQNTVFDITQDEIGYLWFGTEEGLVRFDGLEFKIFDYTTFPELVSPMFIDIEASTKSELWAASRSDLVSIKNGTATHISFEPFSKDHISDITLTSDGILLGGTVTGKIFRFKDDSLSWVNQWNDLKKELSILTIEQNGTETLIGTTNGLYSFDHATGNITKVSFLNNIPIRSIHIISNNNYWVGTESDGIFHNNNGSIKKYGLKEGLQETFINDLYSDQSGSIWGVTSSSGLFHIDKDHFLSFPDFESLREDLRSIYISDTGIIWIGSTGSGLTRLKPAEVLQSNKKWGLSSTIILPIYQHKNGDIWIGTAGQGVRRIKNNDVIAYTRSSGLSNEIILTIYGTENYIYAGTAYGLNRFNLSSESFDKVFTTKDGLASNIVQAVYEDASELVWIATRSGGIHTIKDGNISQLNVPNELREAEFVSFFEDSKNNIWIGSNGNGALKISPERSITVFSKEDGLNSNVTHYFYEDEEGDIWVTTSYGLALIEGDQITSYNRSNGLKTDEIYFIKKDRHGFLWLSSNFGLERMHASELKRAKKSSSTSFKFHTQLFTDANGMPNSEANGGIFPAGWEMQNGEIWIPTVEGPAIIPSYLTNRADRKVNIHFQAIRYGNETISQVENISIPAGVHYLEADYTSINFTNPKNVDFEYRISQLDTDWTDVGNRRTIYLTLQNPGSYTLEIRAFYNGTYSDLEKQNFTIQPFFYQSWWFKLLILFISVNIIFLVIKLRSESKISTRLQQSVEEKTKELQKGLKEKNVLLEEVHHRVKNNLAVISGLLQIQQFETEDDITNKILGNSVARIKSLALIHEKLYQSESLSNIEFQSYLKDLIRSITQSSDTFKEINIHLESDEVLMNVNQAVPCALILNEVTTNALEHAFQNQETGNIWITVSKTNNSVTFSVKDNGIGISEDDYLKSKSIGITIIKTLIDQLDASFKIVSEEGTKFVFSFKLQDIKGAHGHNIM